MKKGSITSKSGNRRVLRHSPVRKNEHLLDVKVRSRTARKQRNKKFGGIFFLGFFVICLGVAGYYGGVNLLNRFFFQNPAYALHHLNVELDDAMTHEEFIRESGLREGKNIFSVNLASVEARLMKDPRVSAVQIDRTLPDKISVQITHRRPIAWISLGEEAFSPENAYLVGSDGTLMKPEKTTPEYLSLPVILGIPSDKLHEGEIPDIPTLHAALELIKTNNEIPGSLLQIRTIDGTKEYRLEVINDQKTQIMFATKDFNEQLERLNTLLANCNETKRQVESVNLMVHRNTPVRFVMADIAPPPKDTAIHSPSKHTRVQ